MYDLYLILMEMEWKVHTPWLLSAKYVDNEKDIFVFNIFLKPTPDIEYQAMAINWPLLGYTVICTHHYSALPYIWVSASPITE